MPFKSTTVTTTEVVAHRVCAFLQDLEKEAEIRETDEVPMEEILQLKREADSQLSEEAKRAKNVLLGDDGFY